MKTEHGASHSCTGMGSFGASGEGFARVGKRLQRPPVPAEPSRGKKIEPASPDKELLTALTTPIEGSRSLVQVMLTLPKAHIRVLDTEASVFGMRRYQFLELLLLGELSQPMLVRPQFLPPYRFTRAALDAS